jgi:sialate O-acetylesterase
MDDPRAAIAVTIDVGDAGDLHPPNKQAVGERLARAARSVVYGEEISPSGPFPVSAELRGDVVAVDFDDVEGQLVAYSGASPIGFELCGEETGSCRYADARVNGSVVMVQVEDDKPVHRIRYAWADSPIVTLFDGSGLPVGPFEMPVEPGR